MWEIGETLDYSIRLDTQLFIVDGTDNFRAILYFTRSAELLLDSFDDFFNAFE